MKNMRLAFAVLCILLAGCAAPQGAEQNTGSFVSQTATLNNSVAASPDTDVLPDTLDGTYYLSSEDPVHAYLQNHSIQRFFNMWFESYIGEDIQPHWNYDTLAPVQLLDHQFNSIARPGVEFYTCTFSTDDGRRGYLIVSYGEGGEGPYIGNWSLHETTPYQYDLRANREQIAAALKETDIDLSTASAKRVEWIDTDKKRGDRIILFTDGKDDRYICYFGDDDFTVQKQ